MTPTPSPTPLPEPLPDSAFCGNTSSYLETVDPGHRRALCLYALRLFAAARRDKRDNGAALEVLADLEIAVLTHFDDSKPPVKTVWSTQ